MAQHDFNIANAGGATVRADINNVLAAIQSSNSGTSAPSSTVAGMLWLDTSGGLPYALKIRDGGNNHWLTLASVTDPGSDGNIETSATIKGTIDSSADLSNANFPFATQAQVFGTKTEGTISSGTTTLTVASGSGISNGDFVVGQGIPPGTTVSSGGGTTSITLSANATETLSSTSVMFYTSTKLLSPGLVGGMLCRAWINFDGTSTPAIRASGNVSSITDNGTGDYTVTFTTAMPDNDYAVAGMGRHNVGVSDDGVFIVIQTSDGATGVTTSSVRISCLNAATAVKDSPIVSVAIFR